MDHSQFKELAEFPYLIQDVAQKSELAMHIEQCEECANQLQKSLLFEARIIEPIRREFKHLGSWELRKLRRTGFVPGKQPSRTSIEWHANVCLDCRSRYLANMNSGLASLWHPSLGLWSVIALFAVMVIGTLLYLRPIWRNQPTVTYNPPLPEHKNELVSFVSPPRLYSVLTETPRSGVHRSAFLRLEKASRILVDTDTDAFAHELQLIIKDRLQADGHNIVVTRREAEGRIRISTLGPDNYKIEYLSGDKVWTVEEHCLLKTPQTAEIAAQLIIKALTSTESQ
jgi:hypothetical protein